MSELILAKKTKQDIGTYLAHPTQVLCLIGPVGAGKGHLAAQLAGSLLGNPTQGAILVIDASSDGGIESVRQLQSFLQLKTPGKAAWRRAAIIERAELLSNEAQNALLKTLEEPPADTIFMLTASSAAELKPTIRSRVHAITVQPLSRQEAETAFSGNLTALDKAYALSGGYVGLLHALMNDPEHELVTAVSQAKQLLQAPAFERLTMVDELIKQKTDLSLLLYALQRVLGAVMSKAQPAQLKKLVQASRILYETEQYLNKSANRKLLLTDLFLHL